MFAGGILKSFFAFVCCFILGIQAFGADPYQNQYSISVKKMIANIDRNDIAAGAVVASPSKYDPDYFFHWIRDAALVMDVVVGLYQTADNGADKKYFQNLVENYIRFSYSNQNTQTLSGLGEPKFHVNGNGFEGPWGRPQNDGPALRAVTVMKYLRSISFTHDLANKVIQTDIEYVLNNWQKPSFDLWEEVRGQHFYTLMVQRRALTEARGLFKNPKFTSRLQKNIQGIEQAIEEHYKNSSFILTTLNYTDGLNYKYSNLDSAVVLALLHGKTLNPQIAFSDVKAKRSVEALAEAFNKVYPVNHQLFSHMVPAIGRYPEDRYYGGNPWFLTTFAFAEYYFNLAMESGNPSYINIGEQYLNRGLLHKDGNGQLDEQINKFNGYMLSAHDLTWSYASYISAVNARTRAIKMKKH